MCEQFQQLLADDIGDNVWFAERVFAKNGALQSLAESAYRLAPDRGWAKEAIAQKTLLLSLGDHPASVPTWLSSVAPFWGHPSALEYWQSAAHALVVGARIRVALADLPEVPSPRKRKEETSPEGRIKLLSSKNAPKRRSQQQKPQSITERQSITRRVASITTE